MRLKRGEGECIGMLSCFRRSNRRRPKGTSDQLYIVDDQICSHRYEGLIEF